MSNKMLKRIVNSKENTLKSSDKNLSKKIKIE